MVNGSRVGLEKKAEKESNCKVCYEMLPGSVSQIQIDFLKRKTEQVLVSYVSNYKIPF